VDPFTDLSTAQAPWLEVLRGDAPILLIAPHGGRAGAAARATLHPKVNDLETAAITRELAARLGASAFINFGMDRNELDCNRLSQLMAREPWLLSALADHLAQLAVHHGRVTVLLIHGWNIIEPRVDLGLGLRERNGGLHPPRGAYVSASDEFIRGPASALAERLRAAAIVPTFGLRYPGGGAQNLLQAFTPRHAGSTSSALRRLAELATAGLIDALQLELSVALRLPGPPREAALSAIAATFASSNGYVPAHSTTEIMRVNPPGIAKPRAALPAVPPFRIGVEFYDARLRLGGMASFDFGPGAAGGRIMMLFEQRRVALFTGEGGAIRRGNSVSLGPLTLDASPHSSGLRFRGPAVVVDDGTAYLSVEGALAGGRLDSAMEVDVALDFADGAPRFGELLASLEALLERSIREPSRAELAGAVPPHASFGSLRGVVILDGAARRLDAVARVGISFVGLGPEKFVSRRMLWAFVSGADGHQALELRALEFDAAPGSRIVHVLHDGGWSEAEVASLELETASPYSPPVNIAASLRCVHGGLSLEGVPDTFMTLSRPGPDGTRIHTSLGFANYCVNGASGVGMYEYSRRVGEPGANAPEADDD
jgi:hypothetical protein